MGIYQSTASNHTCPLWAQKGAIGPFLEKYFVWITVKNTVSNTVDMGIKWRLNAGISRRSIYFKISFLLFGLAFPVRVLSKDRSMAIWVGKPKVISNSRVNGYLPT